MTDNGFPDGVTLRDFAPQGESIEGLLNAMQAGRLPHALLISGGRGTGKRTLARLIAMHQLCTGLTKPCGRCDSCLQVMHYNHPDYTVLRPGAPIAETDAGKGGKTVIPISDIAELRRRASRASYEGHGHVFVLQDVHKTRAEAQNALLKTLEEPLPGVHILLVTDHPEMLLDTIASRCRRVALHPWPDMYILRYLREHGVTDENRMREAVAAAGGSFGLALELAQDERYWETRRQLREDFFNFSAPAEVYAVAAKWAVKEKGDSAKKEKEGPAVRKLAPQEVLEELQGMMRSLMAAGQRQQRAEQLADYAPVWQRMAASGDPSPFLRLLDDMTEYRRMMASNVAAQPLMERLLFRMWEERRKW